MFNVSDINLTYIPEQVHEVINYNALFYNKIITFGEILLFLNFIILLFVIYDKTKLNLNNLFLMMFEKPLIYLIIYLNIFYIFHEGFIFGFSLYRFILFGLANILFIISVTKELQKISKMKKLLIKDFNQVPPKNFNQ